MAATMTALEPPRVSKPSSMSILASGADIFSLLGMGESGSKSESGNAPGKMHVICAVLDDGASTHVRLGSAVFNSDSGSYQMLDGSLQIAEASRGQDGLYRTSSGVYALMSEAEFAEMSRKNAKVQPSATKKQPVSANKCADGALAPAAPARAPAVDGRFVPPASALPSSMVESIGCSANALTRTVVVAGNFEGDSTRLDVVMQQSRPIAVKAASHNNRLCYAFLGNVVPDVHTSTQSGGGTGSFERVVEMARMGITIEEGVVVMPEDVTLIAGPRELAWLRLANVSASREITRYDDPRAKGVLSRPTPFSEAPGISRLPGWVAHNESLHELQKDGSENVTAVMMLLKLISMAQNTMNAPGLVRSFAADLTERGAGDAVAFISLNEFLIGHSGAIGEGVAKLIHPLDNELTPEGLGLMPAAKMVVDEILTFATTTFTTYMRKSKLVHCISDVNAMSGDGGLWLASSGTDGGGMVGKLPSGVHKETLSVKWDKGSAFKVQWASDMNKQFADFFRRFSNAEVDANVYESYIAMSVSPRTAALPLSGLRAGPSSSCQGVVADKSTPFGTITRRILVDGGATTNQADIVGVLESWSNINTDAYTPSTFWSVATWCGGTKRDLLLEKPVVNHSESMTNHLYNVSVTLASLLSTRVGDRKVSDFGLGDISGLLGPVVATTAPHKNPMRIVCFTHPDIESAFVVQLPEAFVQFCLDYYNYDFDSLKRPGEPYLASEGFVALPDESAIPLNLPGLSEPEVALLRSDLGTRVWALPKKRSEKGIASFNASDYSAIAAMRDSDGPQRSIVIPGYTVFHTRLTDSDPFAGLHIGLAKVPGIARMTLDTDTTEFQHMFRVAASQK